MSKLAQIIGVILSCSTLLGVENAYVGNTGSDNVSIIKLSDDTVPATPSVGDQPYGIAITSDNATAYVANFGAGTISKIDLFTQLAEATITVGGSPYGIALTPDDAFAYVTDNANPAVYKIDLSTNTVVATIMVAGNPRSITIDSAGTYAYIAVPITDGYVYRIDLMTDMVDATSSSLGSTSPSFFAIDPSGTLGYGLTSSSSPISEFQVPSLSFTTGFAAANPTGIAFKSTLGGYYGYIVSSSGNSVLKYDLSMLGKPLVATITAGIGTAPLGIAISGDEAFAYVTNSSSGSVSKIDLSSDTVVGTIAVGTGPRDIVIAESPTLLPPQNFRGVQKKNEGGLQYSLFNRLTWDASPNSRPPLAYDLYRNGTLLASLSNDTFEFDDLLVEKGAVNEYSLIAIAVEGAEDSSPVIIQVP
jgi:YVTN family beta-propeller protein